MKLFGLLKALHILQERELFIFVWLIISQTYLLTELLIMAVPSFLFFRNTHYQLTELMFCRACFGEYRNETLFLIMYYQGFISSKELVPLFYLVKPASIPYLHARRVQTDSGIRVVSGEKEEFICFCTEGAIKTVTHLMRPRHRYISIHKTFYLPDLQVRNGQ